MVKNKIKTRVLTFVSTFIILCGVFAISCFAQAPNIDRENYPQTECILYAYYNDGSEDWTYHPVYIVDVTNWNYNDPSAPVGDISFIVTEQYYSLFGNDNDTIFTLNCYVFARMFTPSYTMFNNTNITLNEMIESGYFPLVETSLFTSAVSSAFGNQFTYWENEIEEAELNGYNNGFNGGYNEGLTVGYTNALNDSDTFIQSIFKIFEAPFVFVQNITGFELFGIRVFDIFSFFIIISIGIFLFNKLRRFLPL